MKINDEIIYGEPSVGTDIELDEKGKRVKKEVDGYKIKKDIDLSTVIIACVTGYFDGELANVSDSKFMKFENSVEKLVRNCITNTEVRIRDFLSEDAIKKSISNARKKKRTVKKKATDGSLKKQISTEEKIEKN